MLIGPLSTVIVIILALFLSGVKIVREYERGVIFRLGRLTRARGPGIIYVIPLIEQMYRMDLRTITLDVPSQDVITRVNVSVKAYAVLYFLVVDANRAVVDVQNYLYAASLIDQAAVRRSEAAAIMEAQPVAIQLRLLQALSQVGTERNSTIILPIPVDLVRSLVGRRDGA